MGQGMNPWLYADEYSQILLGTTASPGTCVISGHDSWKNWKTTAAKGTTGASNSLEGDAPREFTVTFYLAGDEFDGGQSDFDQWEDFEALIKTLTSGPTPIALPIYHPDLASRDITEVSSGGLGGAVHDGKGGKIIAVKFVQYIPPKPKPAQRATAKPGVVRIGVPQKPDPNADAKARFAALAAEAAKP